MKSVLKNSVIALAFILLSSSCAKVFYSADAQNLSQQHRAVAVMPSEISISAKGANKKVLSEILDKQEALESLNFQLAIYAWMQMSKSEGKIVVEIQDIETTNTKLQSAGYPEKLLTEAEICKILGVDGIIVSSFELAKPYSKTIVMPIDELTTATIYSDKAKGMISISDCANKKTIWSYQYKSDGDSPQSIIRDFMKGAGKKMPYIKQRSYKSKNIFIFAE